MRKKIVVLMILFLLVFSMIFPMGIGYKLKTSFEQDSQIIKNTNTDQISQIWPLHKNDPQLTGRCIYDTSENKGGEKWKYLVDHHLENTVVIDDEGILYAISWDGSLYAIYQNGTIKWKNDLSGWHTGAPAIGQDGTIYVGTDEKFYAFYPNGTQLWVLDMKSYYSDPVIDSNGTIYVSTYDKTSAYGKSVCAIYPNGTIKWEYKTDGPFISGSAIDKNGNVYFIDNGEYACCLNSDGDFKWSFKLVDIRGEPVIGDDGTIYVVSYGLYALYPNGTLKWFVDYSYHEWYGYPSITHDGNIVLCGSGDYVTSLNPVDGSVIWQYYIGNIVADVSLAVIGGDGSIYFAYSAYSDDVAFLCALNPDGSLKWKTYLDTDIQPDYVDIRADPSIGSDGTVYIASSFGRGGSNLTSFGYINAIGKDDAVIPEPPVINGPANVKRFVNYEYTLRCSIPPGQNVYYLIEWDDQLDYVIDTNNWIGPYSSEEEVKLVHYWDVWGVKVSNVKVMVRGEDNLCSPWGCLDVNIPRTKILSKDLFLRFLENLQDAFPILRYFVWLR